MKHLKHPATIIAAVAMFVALGGGAAAYASGLINGSQIKNHSIPAKKLTASAIKSLRGQRGARGPAGPKGAPGATGATGAAGAPGSQGPPGPFVTAVPPSGLLTGEYSISGVATGASNLLLGSITFAFPLSAAPTAHFIASGGAIPAGCTGTAASPDASPGNLCVFERTNSNGTVGGVFKSDGTAGTDPLGAIVAFNATAAGVAYDTGTWAVRAPASSAARATPQSSQSGKPFSR